MPRKSAAAGEDDSPEEYIRAGILDLYKRRLAPQNLNLVVAQAARLRVGTAFCTGYPVEDAHLPAFGQLDNVTVLGLMQTRVMGPGIPGLAQMPRLEVLDLTACPLTGESMDAFDRFSTLRVLRLSGTTVPTESLRGLAKCRVRELELDEIPVTDDDLEFILRLPQIQHLSISGNRPGTKLQYMLQRFSRPLSVKVLDSAHLQDAIPIGERFATEGAEPLQI